MFDRKECFICDQCGETFEKMWSDEEAEQEANLVTPGLMQAAREERATVCEDCYCKIMGGIQ
jgi:hypothetical protein